MTTEGVREPAQKPDEKSAMRWLVADALVYLVLALLVWGTWRISLLGIFKAGDDLGYWIGVAGSVMMLLLFTYPLRKYFRFAHSWGNIRWWFWLHMILGVLGPLLVLLHSTFHVGSLNAGVALYSMIIVALSGVVGRFLYQAVNRGLHGRMADFKALQVKAGLDKEDARSRLAFAPAVEQLLKDFEARELVAGDGVVMALRNVCWLPVLEFLVYRRCVAELNVVLPKLAASKSWSKEDLKRRSYRARQMVARYLSAAVRVTHYSALSTLFSFWHVAHIPFVYILIVTALVHVYAVHAY
jgi:hypothetical protein